MKINEVIAIKIEIKVGTPKYENTLPVSPSLANGAINKYPKSPKKLPIPNQVINNFVNDGFMNLIEM